jgi:hypothetical protein
VSHDLIYIAHESRNFKPDEAREYLAKIPHCEVRPTEAGGFQGWYENKNSGVYWSCAWHQPSDEFESPNDPEAPLGDGVADTGLAFNLNFMRPSYFGLEAMPYAAAIARDLRLLVYDPQDDARAAEPDVEKLTASWMKGNEWAARGMDNPKYMDSESALSMWRYNSHLEEAQKEFDAQGVDVFVPTIMPLLARGSDVVRRNVVWGAPVRLAFPPCDAVTIVRMKFSLGQLFGRKKSHDWYVAAWSDVISALSQVLEKQTVCGLEYLVQTEQSEKIFKEVFGSVPSVLMRTEQIERVPSGGFVDIERPRAAEK